MKTIETHRAPANFGYWFVILVGILTVLFSSSSMAQPVKTIDPDKARVGRFSLYVLVDEL